MFRVILFSFLFFPLFLSSQKGIIPFAGIVYESRGVLADNIDATLNGDTWTSNRIPLNAEMKVRAINPRGFITENGLIFPGVQVLILTMSNDTLANLENIMGEQSLEGIESEYLKKLSVTLTFEPGNSKPGDSLRIVSRFFDTRGPADLWTKLDLIIVDESLPIETTTTTNSVSVQGEYKCITTGFEVDEITTLVTESIGFDTPNEIVRFGKIPGLTAEEFNAGKVLIFSYDSQSQINYVSLLPQPKLISGMHGQDVEITVRDAEKAEDGISLTFAIPLNGDIKFARVRWESADKLKVFDIVTTIN